MNHLNETTATSFNMTYHISASDISL